MIRGIVLMEAKSSLDVKSQDNYTTETPYCKLKTKKHCNHEH